MRIASRLGALSLVLLCAALTSGCLTTLGAFRGADSLGKGRTEVGVRAVTNGWTTAGVANVRHGVGARTDVEGLLLAGVGEDEQGFGGGAVVTHQLPGDYDWLALGAHGAVTTYAHMVGGRLTAGTNPYLAFERNYHFETSSRPESVNMLIGGLRISDTFRIEVGAFPIIGEDDFFIHVGVGLTFPIGTSEPTASP